MSGVCASYGVGRLEIGGEKLEIPINSCPSPAVKTFFFNCAVYSNGYNYDNLKHCAVPGFNRFSGLRYQKDKNYLEHIYVAPYSWDSTYQYWLWPPFSHTRSFMTMRFTDSAGAESLSQTDPSMAVGSLVMTHGNPTMDTAGEYPTGSFGFPLITAIDVPGTTIGNMHKHIAGSNYIFYQAASVPSSQGSIAITGVYNPAENVAYPMTYQVYYTKSGGTGKIDAGVGSQTNGRLYAGGGGDDYFADADGHTHFIAGTHDNGLWYIAVRSGTQQYTYKIKSIKGASPSSEVYIDSKDVNQGVSNEGPGLSWTLREGPVAEYFFRRKRYVGGNTFTTAPNYLPSAGGLLLGNANSRLFTYMDALQQRPMLVSIHDRGCCRWMLMSYGDGDAAYAPYALQRWTEYGLSGVDVPYADGDIDNMPSGIRYWRDMDIDDTSSNKIWIGIDDSSTGIGYSLFKVDPYPGGNAERPNCVAKYGKSSSQLPSKNVRGVCCDTINNRVWVICGNDGAGGDGGIAFTDDGGANWSRFVESSALSGAAPAAKATGQISLTAGDGCAQGSINFAGNPSDGDWIQIPDALGTSIKLEFESGGGVTAGNIPVTIGASEEQTMRNLFAVIDTYKLLQEVSSTLVVTSAALIVTIGSDWMSFTAKTGGSDENALQVRFLDPGAPSQPLTTSEAAGLVTVSLATNGVGALISKFSDIKAAVNANGSLSVTAEKFGTGDPVAAAFAATNLSGGDERIDLKVWEGGSFANVALTKSGTNISVTGLAGGSLVILDGEKFVLDDGSGLGAVNYWFARGIFGMYRGGYGYLAFVAQPNDGDTFTLNDSVVAAKTFEFDNGGGVTPGNIAVTIGATLADTENNTVTAVIGAGFGFHAFVFNTYQVMFTHHYAGSATNIAITKSATSSYVACGLGYGSNGSYPPSSGNTGTTSVTFGAASGGIQTISGMTGGTFNADSVGHYLKINGSTYNDGAYLIAAVNSSSSVDVNHSDGQSETVSCTWDQRGDDNNVRASIATNEAEGALKSQIATVINNSPSKVSITATVVTQINLINDDYGSQGNVTITETVSSTAFGVTGMSGGYAMTVGSDGVTLTNPNGLSTWLTELNPGDWISLGRMVPSGTSKRRVLSVTNNNQLVLHSSSSFGGAVAGPAGLYGINKGLLSDAQCRLYLSTTFAASSGDSYVHPPCDYDSSGRLYWISDAATGVFRIHPTDPDTLVQQVTNAQLSGSYAFSNPRTVTVTKFVNAAGSGLTTFQDNVWVGSHVNELTRIYNWNTPSITRYHHSATNNWPTSINLTENTAHYMMRVMYDKYTGSILLTAQHLTSTGWPDAYVLANYLKNTHASFGQVAARLGSAWYYRFYYDIWMDRDYQTYCTANFDDIGLGSFFAAKATRQALKRSSSYSTGMLAHDRQTCFRWNGSSWQMGIVNGYLADIDFRAAAGGPHAEVTVACGYGTKRAMEIETPLDADMYIKFVQAGGGTLQTNEFVIDENTAFACSIGRLKDNTMTASYQVDMHSLPTISRIDEPAVPMGSLWTMEDGVDGGYIDSATDTAMPTYMRGVAEYCNYYANGVTNYPTMDHRFSNPNNPHYLVARRIHETFFDAGDLDIWNDTGVGKAQCPTGTYTFTTSADVNKTVRVHGAVTAGNNTSKLITSVDEGTNTITLSSAWAANENDRQWTLRLIPAVGYVVLNYQTPEAFYCSPVQSQYKLHSSKDAGYSWDEVKTTKYFSGVAANDPITKVGAVGYIDAGVFVDSFSHNRNISWSTVVYGGISPSIVFDIRELSQEARRRTHWKIHRENPGSIGTNTARPASMILLDENYAPMGPESLFITDWNDSRYNTMNANVYPRAIVYDSVNAATGVDMSYGYSFTDMIQVGGGESFYEQSGSDLIAWANSTKVKSATATFSIASVAKYLRIPSLNVSSFNKFTAVSSFVDANNVLTSHSVTATATGSITGVTNNAGQAVFASASHTLSNGDPVTIAGTTNYNGTWIVANVVAGVSFEAGVAYVSSQTGTWAKGQSGLSWALTTFGPTDKVRFDDMTTFFRHVGRPLRTMTYEVLDIPTSARIQTKYKDVPLAVNSTFMIEREFTSTAWSWQQTTSWDTLFGVGWTPPLGIFQVSDSAQFLTIQEDSATETATTPADDDGDGWTNSITLTGITLSAQAAADDWILLYKTTGTMYRRWYKIKSITSYGPGAVIKTYEDEIVCSTTFKWKVCRKRGLKMRMPAITVVGNAPIS